MQAFSQFTESSDSKKKQAAASNSRRRVTSPSMLFLTWPAIPELSGYRVSSRSAGKNKQFRKPLHSVKGQQRNKASRERNKNNTATGGDIFAGSRVAVAYRRGGSRTWAPGPCGSGLRTPCLRTVVKSELQRREESRLAGSPNTSPKNSFPAQNSSSVMSLFTPSSKFYHSF